MSTRSRSLLGLVRWGVFGQAMSQTLALGTSCAICALHGSEAIAQITPDRTLPNNSSVTREGNTFNITGGTQAGRNLFHSFQEFSVPTGSTAFFNNTADIQNIFSRVTGRSVSNIDGLIKASGTANLFVINPNGIIFGQNAQLKIGGSFFASTASSLRFSDGSEFSASNPQAPPLLTVNLTPGLQYGSTQGESSISNAGQLAVDAGKTLTLHGGTITSTGSLIAPGGAITLEANGNIFTGDIFTIVPQTQNGGAIRISSHNGEIDTTAGSLISGGVDNGGAIILEAKGNISTGNILTSGIPNSMVRSTNGGEIRISSRDGEINTTAGSVISSGVDNGGAIILEAKGNIRIRSVGSSADQSQAGDINITSKGDINITSKNAGVYTKDDSGVRSETFVAAKGGDINIKARSLVVQDGIQVSANTKGSGSGGNLTIKTTEFVNISGVSATDSTNDSGLFAEVVNSPNQSNIATGSGGNITIETGRLIVENGGKISTSAGPTTTGNPGDLTIKAAEVEISGVAPFGFTGNVPVSALAAATAGEGNGGNLVINTGRLIVRNGATIATSTTNTGNGGSLIINANEFVKVIGGLADGKSVSLLSADTAGVGKAGSLTLITGKLILSDGGAISASTFGSKPGGNIDIKATDSVQISGTSIKGFASGVYAQTFADGNAGNVKISTGQLTVSDRATITTASDSASVTQVPSEILTLVPSFNNSNATFGNAGNLDITANSISLKNQGKLLASTASGTGGNIRLQLRDILLLRLNSQISTTAGTAQQPGDGGKIMINAKNGFIIANPGEKSNITANAFSGSGGKITINATGIYGLTVLSREDLVRVFGKNDISQLDFQKLPSSSITAISQTSPQLNGQVNLNTPDIDPNSGLVELPKVPVNPEVAQGCYTPGYAQSSFVITGRGGLPPNPKDILTPDLAEIDWVSAKPSNNNRSLPLVNTKPNTSIPKRIVEATSAVINAQGQIVLTANSSTVTPDTNRQNFIECHGSYRTHI